MFHIEPNLQLRNLLGFEFGVVNSAELGLKPAGLLLIFFVTPPDPLELAHNSGWQS